MGPGGLHENSKYWNCTGGAAGYIDTKFFGQEHMYDDPTEREIFFVEEYWFGGYTRREL